MRRMVRPARALAIVALFLTGAFSRPAARAETLGDVQASRACRQVVPTDDMGRGGEPEPRRDRDALARWCETIGPILIQPLAVQRASGPIDRIVIVTWNVHVGSGNVGDLVARLRRGEFTEGRPVTQFVLLLQETYRRDTAVPAQIPRGFPAPSRIAAAVGRGPDVATLPKSLGVACSTCRRCPTALRRPTRRIVARDPVDLDLHDPWFNC